MGNILKSDHEYDRVLSNPDNIIASDGLLDSLGDEWLQEAGLDHLVSWTCQMDFATFTLKGELVSFSLKKVSKSLAIKCSTGDVVNLLKDIHLRSFSIESVPMGLVLAEEYDDTVIVDVQFEDQYNSLVLVTLKQLQNN
tara:strand:- start:158 stop:574 length:417 start_codon:yes stop_codon:yes gene_type:complete